MADAKHKLADVLREAIVWLSRPDNDFAWSSWEDAEHALAEISAQIATLEAGKLPPKLDLTVLFAPTGPIQEVSISSGWGDEFLELAKRFDCAVQRAYRWSLIAAIRFIRQYRLGDGAMAEEVPWQPYRESLRATLGRTVAIAAVVGAVLAGVSRGGPGRWAGAALLAMWPAFGGHWVEVFYLNALRPRLPAGRGVNVAARLAVWFVGGAILALGMAVTARVLPGFGRAGWLGAKSVWWVAGVGGVGFIAIELVVHLVLQLRGRGSFYNGRG